MAIDKMIYRLGRPDPALADTAIADGWWAKGELSILSLAAGDVFGMVEMGSCTSATSQESVHIIL